MGGGGQVAGERGGGSRCWRMRRGNKRSARVNGSASGEVIVCVCVCVGCPSKGVGHMTMQR